jgi:hypothetical protein
MDIPNAKITAAHQRLYAINKIIDAQEKLGVVKKISIPKVTSSISSSSIVFTRPLKELYFHIINFKCPSLKLLVRSITVLFLGIFRGHFSDHVMILANTKEPIFIHSLEGKVCYHFEKEMRKSYPYVVESALVYSIKADIFINSFENLPMEINAQTIKLRYELYQIDLTNKKTGNTISDLFHSKWLVRK